MANLSYGSATSIGGAWASPDLNQYAINSVLTLASANMSSSSSPKRIVRVYLADTDENIPLANVLLYQAQDRLTDLTDQELFFEIPITELLANHNTLRTTILDKKASQKMGKDVYLEPLRIRDLKMTVVTVASF